MLKPVKLVFQNTYKDTCGFCHEETHVTWCRDDNRAVCQDCNSIIFARQCEKYIEHLEKKIAHQDGSLNLKKPESLILEEPIMFMLHSPSAGLNAYEWIKGTLLARYKYNRFIQLESKKTIALHQTEIINLVPEDMFDAVVMKPARAKCLHEQFGKGVSIDDLSARELQLLNVAAKSTVNLIDSKGELIDFSNRASR